jgi:hypothetical protein
MEWVSLWVIRRACIYPTEVMMRDLRQAGGILPLEKWRNRAVSVLSHAWMASA